MGTEAPIPAATLPEDPAALRLLVRERERQIVELERQRDRRIAELERAQSEARRQWEQTRQQMELETLRLAHQLELLRKRYYGPRADRVEPNQLLLEFAVALEKRPVDAELLAASGASEPIDAQTVRRVRPRKGRRDLALFDHLPTTQQVHDLPPEAKPCPCCATPRELIGQETSWQIEYLPASFQRIEHVRLKYACPACEPNGESPRIAVADKPAGAAPIDKGMAGPGLLAYVITSKFADYLPLYRLENIFARSGFAIDRATMCVWAGDVADLLRPVYDRMVARVLASHVIHTDDTVMPMLAPHSGGKTRQARMWVYAGDDDHPYQVFDFTLSRSRDGPAMFLRHFRGVLQADAYGGYDGICVEKSITQAGCWAHARRKFVDCQSLDRAITAEALTLIGKLFAIEEQAKVRGLSPPDRLALRREHSVPVLETLHQRLRAWRERLLPKHPVAQAIGYALNQWGPLGVFTTDGAVAIDNNLAEREMKRQAINRKNSLFVGNPRGGRTAAILSSITSTCRRQGIDPQLYLTQLLANLPTTPLSQLDDWLPDRWKQRQATIAT